MIEITQATPEDAAGIPRMCSAARRATCKDLFAEDYINRVVAEYYNLGRITREVSGPPTKAWGGYIVAKDGDAVVGAIGGAVEAAAGQVWVLYREPSRLREGIGTRLLGALTEQQRAFGTTEQWISVEKRNAKGLPFYLAKGFIEQETHPRTAEGAQTVRLRREL